MYITSSGLFSIPTCLIASKNGRLSISPTVPPISVITTSAPVFANEYTLSFIAFVICGITCTVFPR